MTAPGAHPTTPAPPPPPSPAGNAGGWKRVKIAGILIAALAAVGALLQGVGAFSSDSKGGSTTVTADHGGNAVNGNQTNSCVAFGAGATVTCPSPVPPEMDDVTAERSIIGKTAPTPPGPWPFTVLYDKVAGKNMGVWVRSTPTRDGFHVGLALHAQPVWVDCVRTTDFNPEPGLPTGPRWYKVHWPHADRSDAPMSSSPSDPAQGWVYVYYLRPNGTNGKVPTC